MQRLALVSVCILLIIPDAGHAGQTVVELVKTARPAVVLVQTFDRDNSPVRQGSGFFINDEGDLITNKHVVQGAYSATAKLITGEQYTIEGASAVDLDSDIVRLHARVKGRPTPFLKPVNILPLVGEDVVVVGNPLGLESTVSKGIVSAVRTVPTFGTILQISAPISAGSSGSPVLNMKGQVIGVATLTMEEGQALNFAVPSDVILNMRTEDNLIGLAQLALVFTPTPGQDAASAAIKAVNNPCLKFLPPDWWLVGNFELMSFLDLAVNMPIAGDTAMDAVINQYLEMIEGMVGIDPRTQVQYVTFILAGNPERNLQGLVVIKGTFENQTPELRLRLGLGAEMETTPYRGATLYESSEIGYAFPEESTLIVGSPALLRRSVRAVAESGLSLPHPLRGILERTNGASLIWLAMKPSVILDTEEFKAQRREYSKPFDIISSIECASLFSERTHDGFLVSAIAYVQDQKQSKELHLLLSEAKRNLLDVTGANVFLCSFLTMSDALLDGNYVRWDTRVTEGALLDLWNTKFVRKKVRDYGGIDSTAEAPPSETKKESYRGPNPGDVATNSIGMKLVYTPPGEFMMGSRDSGAEVARKSGYEYTDYTDEYPQHLVSISKGFYMGATEVTQAEWNAVMSSNPSNLKGDNLPVDRVSWNDAVKFCELLTRKEGKAYRLPTETEWEYACRAGTTTPFHTGETISTNQANYDGNCAYGNSRYGVYRQKTTEVRSFVPNIFGFYDMHGNVREWCSDRYDQSYYDKRPSVDPQGPSTGEQRVLRGGSWDDFPWLCRSADRDGDSPDTRSSTNGFRVVRELED